ncbi:hypothetical protein [Laribacter hongkongensis]|uniref:hypothetical protein n=1 Tax=Laribacter hongkongensis TaxID=168471 RepID=UPI001EFCE307|nr:hypothetical protein [Laribacter hongkongensis]MCG9084270.1 hypothetical protein [Laribacter hongkongensis]
MPVGPAGKADADKTLRVLEQADGLLVTAGAGMGVDSGLPACRTSGATRASDGTIRHWGSLRFEEVANARMFERDPALAWGFYGYRLKLYRTTLPHAGFAEEAVNECQAKLIRGFLMTTKDGWVIKLNENKEMNIAKSEKLARAFAYLLNSIDWSDPVVVAGIKEGVGKFLSNASIYLEPGSKYSQGDYYSAGAIAAIKNNVNSDLIYEHIVPKAKYIQNPCIEKARSSTEGVSYEFVFDLVCKYWKIAIITKDEDKKLTEAKLGIKMPDGWDGVNVLARYEEVGISLIPVEEINEFK